MSLTRRHCLDGLTYPVVYEQPATGPAQDLVSYVRDHQDELLGELSRYGALLFRGFAVEGARGFQDAIRVFAPNLSNYAGGDSPRSAVTDKVYTSTSYPASLPISLHNEMSYTRSYPAVIAFYCERAPDADGETPLADCRRVLGALPRDVVDRFRHKRIRYIQNLHNGAGLGKSWRDTFETDDRAKVEAILTARGAEFQWRTDGTLHVTEVIDPIVTHPRSGDAVFFSQAHLWHVSSLDKKTRDALLKVVGEDKLYHSCTFGDGSPISDDDLGEIRRSFDAATIAFPWRQGDVLVVDNLLVAHGRRPFKGERRVLVAMGGPA